MQFQSHAIISGSSLQTHAQILNTDLIATWDNGANRSLIPTEIFDLIKQNDTDGKIKYQDIDVTMKTASCHNLCPTAAVWLPITIKCSIRNEKLHTEHRFYVMDEIKDILLGADFIQVCNFTPITQLGCGYCMLPTGCRIIGGVTCHLSAKQLNELELLLTNIAKEYHNITQNTITPI